MKEFKHYLKHIFKRIKLLIRNIIYSLIIALIMILTAYHLDNSMLAITLCIIEFIVLIFIYFVLFMNLSKPICSENVKFKMIDNLTQDSGVDGKFISFINNYVIEYSYKNKTYHRIIVVNEKDVKTKYNVKVCKFIPRIIYVENVNK